MSKTTRWTRLVLAAFVAAASATGLSAQTADEVPVQQIEQLEAEAEGYLEQVGKWDRAASLFRRAAELRSPADPAAVEDLLRAARLSFYDGRALQSVRDFETAGQRALDRGDVLVAANAFADAAWVAGNEGRGQRAHGLLARAQLLSNSPLIREDDRSQLRTRWGVAGIQP